MLVDFVGGASASLDVAIYDFRLTGAAADAVIAAFHDASARGVQTRLVFNVEHTRRREDPPPPLMDWDLLHRLDIPFHPVNGVPDLMHHKYIVRDAGGATGAVLSGSTNWTDDSWTREENVLIAVQSPELSLAYSQNFDELWTDRNVATSGHIAAGWTELVAEGLRLRVRPHFCPGGAQALVDEMVGRIHSASARVRVCSPVITAGPILRALLTAAESGAADVGGAYDRTQMDGVVGEWTHDLGGASWKVEVFEHLVASGFSGKRSTPYEAGSTHDFMHAKVLVADDCAFVGSFNLSSSGETNAENVLQVESREVADSLAGFVDSVAERYRPPGAPLRPGA